MTRRRPVGRSSIFASCFLGILAAVGIAFPAHVHAAEKPRLVNMHDYFRSETSLHDALGPETSGAPIETTLFHQIFYTDFDGGVAPGWGLINYRANQPTAWHLVTGGPHACAGTSWWMGQTGFLAGDGYDNNWVQSLVTNPSTAPINLAGTNGNKLTFKSVIQTETDYDIAWVLIKGAGAMARWDTLATYSGDYGPSCVSLSVDIPDSFTTVTQPVQLQFLFGSDLNVSAADSLGAFSGWAIDDVQVKSSGNPTGGPVRFFDDMESGSSKWLASHPNPGTLWHLETAPSTSVPSSCFFLNTTLWVPFSGSGYGLVPDHADAMMTSPPIDLSGVFTAATPTSSLRLQFDDWENLPYGNFMFWALWIRGSNNGVTWTPWRNATGLWFHGTAAQCEEAASLNFNPYLTSITGIQPGTKFIQIGFRIRDEKATFLDEGPDEVGPRRLGSDTEGIYFDNIGVYYVYTIAGVEPVGGVPATRASIRRIYPNPFNPTTTIEFSVPRQGPVSVRIHDIHGRQVMTLADASLPAGVYRVKWDGRDRLGRAVASGVYFATIESAGSRGTARMVLLD